MFFFVWFAELLFELGDEEGGVGDGSEALELVDFERVLVQELYGDWDRLDILGKGVGRLFEGRIFLYVLG